MDKKQTAVEWYIMESDRYFIYYKTNRITYNDLQINLKELKGIAKAMEKEQIETAHQNGYYCGNDICNATNPEFQSAEQYYKETYEQ